MNWEAIVAVSEVIGTVAVVATLIYLAIQIREGTKATNAATRESVSKSSLEFLLQISGSAETTEIFLKGLHSDSLEPVDLMRFDMIIHAAFEIFDSTYSQWRRGVLIDEDWEKWREVMSDYVAYEGVQASWARQGKNFSPAFREYVESMEHGKQWM